MASQFIDLTSRSVSVVNASVTSLSWFRAAAGDRTTPSYSFTADTDTGIYLGGSNQGGLTGGGTNVLVWGSTYVRFGSGTALGFQDNAQAGSGTQDTYWTRVSAGGFRFNATATSFDLYVGADNTPAFRSGTNPQTLHVYQTYTSSTSYERFAIQTETGGNVYIGTEKGSGGGTARPMAFMTNGSTRWTMSTGGNLNATGTMEINTTGACTFGQITSSGHHLFTADNTYDIGTSVATRPRTVYAGTSFVAPSTGSFLFSGQGGFTGVADGQLDLLTSNGAAGVRWDYGNVDGTLIVRDRAGSATASFVQAGGYKLGDGVNVHASLATYGAGTAYSLTNSAAAIDLGTTDPVVVLNRVGTYLISGQVNLAYTGATVATETATIKVRRTNNTAADLSAVVVLDLPVSTTLTHTYGIFQIPPFLYTTAATDDSITLFANVSAALGAGTIDATAIGTSLVAVRLY